MSAMKFEIQEGRIFSEIMPYVAGGLFNPDTERSTLEYMK